ncbi:MAG: LrgB family protein, partial [Acidaminococcaceae bacterium]|nr:LrgB family protein [Acidaminococcaceae bacterium]
SALTHSAIWGTLLTLAAYMAGVFLKNKSKMTVMNPLCIAIILVIAVLLVFHMDYEAYRSSSQYITYLLTPAPVCLALPLYERLDLLKSKFTIVLGGILTGVLTCFAVVLALSGLFHLTHSMYVTLLLKSVTMAIGVAIVEQLGGYVPIAAAVIIVTGLLGNMFAEPIFRICKIEDPVARGLALGTASHVIGTARAMELGQTEGAISSLAIVVTGLVTVILVNAFAVLL